VVDAATPDAAGKIAIGSLARALYNVASAVGVAPCAVPVTDSNSPMAGLQADVARWASLVIEHVHLARPHAPYDLDQALYALDVLEVAPDARTAAAAVAKAAALAPKVDAHRLRSFLFRVARPLAAWHRSGLVSCEPAARALCARAPELLKQARSKTERGMVLARLRMLASTAHVSVPELAEPWRSRASGGEPQEAGSLRGGGAGGASVVHQQAPRVDCRAAVHHSPCRRRGGDALCVDARRLEDSCRPGRVRSRGGHMHGRLL